MLKRISKKHQPGINQLDHYVIPSSLSDDNITLKLPNKQQISAFMAEMGRKGGKIGGKRRMQTLSAEERSAIAKRAARARWKEK